MRKKPQGKFCSTCGYMERENPRKQDTRIFCSNCRSEHCSEWVERMDTCPLWVQLTAYSCYYNDSMSKGA